MRAGKRQAERADRVAISAGAALRHRLGAEIAEMLVEPRPPGQRQRVSGLKDRAEPPRAPALDEAEMPPVSGRQHLQDHVGLAVAPRADDDAFLRPFHGVGLSCFRGD